VEIRSGASGNIGTEALARATPDGHSIGTASMHNIAVNPMLFTRLPGATPEQVTERLARDAPLDADATLQSARGAIPP